MNKHITIILFALLLFSCRTEGINISKVVVLDKDFQQIRIIDQPKIIKQVNKLWEELEPIDDFPEIKWTYKLDIDSEKMSGRWLYNEAGYLGKLNKQLKPRFKVRNKEQFNKVILGF